MSSFLSTQFKYCDISYIHLQENVSLLDVWRIMLIRAVLRLICEM